MIAKNEQEDLPGLLSNVLCWADELVVVDDGSTDGSLEILAAHGDRVMVVEHPFDPRQGFAGQRNAGIDAARSDWLLHMDADERVPHELKREVDAAIATNTNVAYRYRRLNFFLHRPMRWGGLQRWNAPQLARKGWHRFEGHLHERCVILAPASAVGQLTAPMWHLNDAGFDERLRKNAQYAELEANRYLASGKAIRWYDLLLNPTRRGLRILLADRSFLDGVPGLIWALHAFSGTFNGYARAWDRQNAIPRSQLEALVSEDQSAEALKSTGKRYQ